ncbi:Uu.00g042830.m01.CDS01 [Anthostomella pinea]|uniref:Uu.00g042830.m01.CDS01 n=1 Tax=Anthostomella pinea TaxID=933095 RepID=A0AAI8VBL3_9PEZI|nr:Uu.00g042830.m01.CDS01 [Anthostomella pinea]
MASFPRKGFGRASLHFEARPRVNEDKSKWHLPPEYSPFAIKLEDDAFTVASSTRPPSVFSSSFTHDTASSYRGFSREFSTTGSTYNHEPRVSPTRQAFRDPPTYPTAETDFWRNQCDLLRQDLKKLAQAVDERDEQIKQLIAPVLQKGSVDGGGGSHARQFTDQLHDEKTTATLSEDRLHHATTSGARLEDANRKPLSMSHSRGGVPPSAKIKGRKNQRGFPSSWGFDKGQMAMKKRVMTVFDGLHPLAKDDMMLSTEHEVRVQLSDGKSYVTDLDVNTLQRAQGFHDATEQEKGIWISDKPAEFQTGAPELGVAAVRVPQTFLRVPSRLSSPAAEVKERDAVLLQINDMITDTRAGYMGKGRSSSGGDVPRDIQALQERIKLLEAENRQLREQGLEIKTHLDPSSKSPLESGTQNRDVNRMKERPEEYPTQSSQSAARHSRSQPAGPDQMKGIVWDQSTETFSKPEPVHERELNQGTYYGTPIPYKAPPGSISTGSSYGTIPIPYTTAPSPHSTASPS